MISFLLPTRGRRSLVERFFESIVETTSSLSQIEVVLYVDDDDADSHDLDSADFHVTRIIGPAMSMGGYNSACFEKARGDVIILANDDMVIRTKDWDKLVLALHEEFEDRIYLGYANDLFKKSRFCTFPILSRRTCELLINPYPCEYQRAFIDVHLFDIFMRLRNAGLDRVRYRDDLVFEHLHYRAGKASFDDTYDSYQKGRFVDDPTFLALTEDRKAAARRLTNIINNKPRIDIAPVDIDKSMPTSVLSAISLFTSLFLFDRELPFGWRLYLWYWFIGRYLAANGYFKLFVK